MKKSETNKLRIRFDRFSTKSAEEIKSEFECLQNSNTEKFKLENAGNHIWLGIGMLHREIWSPTLHIEIDKYEDGRTHIKGIFGPDPILWVLFLVLHFFIGILFVVFGVIAYLKWSVDQSPTFDLAVLFLLVNAWFLLYFVARYNRKKGAHQMDELLHLSEKLI